MTIGVIGAMQEEIAPLLEKYNNYQKIIIGNNTYYKVSHNTHEIIIAYSKIGKVHAAISATIMIVRFGCENIIFSGVAGGLSKDLQVGDLVIATRLCQHDVDITAFGHKLGFIPEGKLFYESDKHLRQIAHDIGREMNLDIKEGTIASGDQFIADRSKKVFLTQEFNAIAVEMEGASVACVCDNFRIPFCIFRSISDVADKQANSSFDDFLQSSATISANFVSRILERILT
ncbi:5'-methylthioadenosine/adenosylhomocysteine nucleosidase [Helicobacter aurati]|uniref:adenosylhomocysteine nucleosidase n=1 Tax=Helicobacter aurati TaxID=137778 RepID=A0A3D8J7Z0_9HELI|nr:5'-methylthioadenosine/adenosylhomocysteine nucleosidase [Helicobacter aurati]RDU73380.1 5'-methylthioadenosine/adenosylhomocysteine nucleosidase [Helicobacter aurati]